MADKRLRSKCTLQVTLTLLCVGVDMRAITQELANVRTKFVEKANIVLIDQLVDDLLVDHVLNEGEKESIREENLSRANKARSLIDMVRNKGDEASRKMIAHLQRRDHFLYAELGLSSGQPAQPEPQTKQQWSTTLIRTSEAFWREKLNDTDIYPAAKSSMRNRVALLITNIKFTVERLNRKGAEKDEANMEKLLTALGYEVVKHTNLTGKAIDDALNEFSEHPKLRETDSVLVVIMSHGKLGAVLGVDWKKEIPDEFLINDIYKHLGPEKCPALLNKPKIIIIQACRGEGTGSVLVRDGANAALVCDNAAEGNFEDDGLRIVHNEKDYISFLSSTPDTMSYRHTVYGSPFIQYVAEVLNTFAHKDDIEELFRKVMQRFEEFIFQDSAQMATKDRCTLPKRFYFFPGL